MRSLAEESAKAFADIAGAPNPKESLKKSFDTVRSSMQNAMAVSNILSEMSARNSAAAAKVIQDRSYAALDEMQSLALTVADSNPLARTKT
jgi:phasin family protein